MAPTQNPTRTIEWQSFCSAAQRLIDHPIQHEDNSLDGHFEEWGRKAFEALASESTSQQLESSWKQLAASDEHQLEADLVAHELSSFESYVNELLAQHGTSGAGTPENTAQGYGDQPLDSTAVETSHSILSTILDSLADMFPALKGLLKAGKEFIDIRKAFVARSR